MDERKKKIAIISICSVVLVAMVVALVVSIGGDDKEEAPELSASQKAITTICETTDYQETCLNSLAGHNTSNPKELIEAAFQASIDYIKEAAENSSALQELQKDPRAKAALQTCGELANQAINDLQRSFTKFTSFDITSVDDILLDLKIWLSGAITHQETCLDSFEDVPGDARKRMTDALKTATEMTSNALAMVAEISTFLESMGMQSFSSRRLLSADLPILAHGDELPDWLDSSRRRLLTASPQVVKPDLIVAKDGSGMYETINEALKDIPKKGNKTFVLYIKEGVYEEKVQFNSSFTHLFVIGDGPTKTRITGKLNFIDGTNTYQTATVAVQGDDFIARDIGFENTAGPEKHQAVALRVSADRAIFYNCHMDAYQDTLYAHTYRQFYRNCFISGTIDFIFGDSAAVFQNCTLLIRKPLDNQQCIVTAQGRKEIRQPTGLVLQNCTLKSAPELYPLRTKIKSYLGRPWKQYSRTIIMESFLDDLIQPDGWLPWNATFALDTLFYTEFNNRGPAAPKKQRVKWAGIKELPSTRIRRFTAAEFLDGNRWIPQTQVPYDTGFIFSVPKDDPNVKYSPVVPEETKDLGSKIEKLISSPPRKDSGPDKHSATSNPTSTSTDSVNVAPPSKVLASPPPPIPPSASSVVIIETNVSELVTPPDSLVDHKGKGNSVPVPITFPGSRLDSNSSSNVLAFSPTSTSPSEDTTALSPISNHDGGFQTDVAALPPNTQTDETSRSTARPAFALAPGGSKSEQQYDMVASSPVSPDDDSDSMHSGAFASEPTSDSSNSISVPSSDLTASAPTSPRGVSAPPPQPDEDAFATNSQGSLSAPAPSPHQANGGTTPPPTTSATDSSDSQPPPSDEAIPSSPLEEITTSPPTSQSGSSDSLIAPEDTTTSPPIPSSGSLDLSPPQLDATASPPTSPIDNSTKPPVQSDEAAPPPTSPNGSSSSSSSSLSENTTISTSASPTTNSGLPRPSNDNATPPPTSPSGGSTPSPPESDATTSPPTSTISNSDSPPPPVHTAAPPPTSTNSNSDSPPPPVDTAVPPPTSTNSNSDSPPPPVDTATPPPTSTNSNSDSPPPPVDTAVPPPTSTNSNSNSPPPPVDTAVPPPTSTTSNLDSPPPPVDTATPPPTSTPSNSDSPPPPIDTAPSPPTSTTSSSDSPPPSTDTVTPPPNSPSSGSTPSPPQSDMTTPPASPASDSVSTSQ